MSILEIGIHWHRFSTLCSVRFCYVKQNFGSSSLWIYPPLPVVETNFETVIQSCQFHISAFWRSVADTKAAAVTSFTSPCGKLYMSVLHCCSSANLGQPPAFIHHNLSEHSCLIKKLVVSFDIISWCLIYCWLIAYIVKYTYRYGLSLVSGILHRQ